MKAVLFLKFLVFIFSILLLAGFTFVAYKIADSRQQSKIKTQETLVSLPTSEKTDSFNGEKVFLSVLTPDEEIVTAFACSDDVCLITKNAEKQSRLLVIYPQTGYLKTDIQLR